DAIYANAGISGGLVPLAEQTVELWQEVLRVNLIGAFLAIKHAAPHMVKQKAGSIICTASVAGLRANAGGNPYSASKAGVISLVQTAANSLYGTGVRVNAICPGLIETGMTQTIFERARERGSHDKIGQLNPLTRYGHPEEIAAAAAMKSDARLARKTAIPAMSSITPQRPAGVRRSTFSFRPGTSSRARRVRSVSIQPGSTAFAWMLSRAHAQAIDFVNCTIPAL